MPEKIEEKPDPIGDLEKTIAAQWRAQGKRLIHQCADWDFLTICEDSPEIAACGCDFFHEEDKILRDKIAENLMSSIPSAIGDGLDVKIDRQNFEDQAARPRLGVEMEEQGSFIPFPLRKQVLSFEEVVSVLRNEGVPKQGIVIFLGEERMRTISVNSTSATCLGRIFSGFSNTSRTRCCSDEGGCDFCGKQTIFS